MKSPPPSVSTQAEAIQNLSDLREVVHQIVKRYDDEAVWDSIQSRDLPAEMLDYVTERLRQGFSYDQIRRSIGIRRTTDKSWKKIMAALKQGFRIDGPAFLVQKAWEVQSMSDKLRDQIMKAFEDGVEVATKEGVVNLKGPSKELSMAVDAYNRLQQGFVKLGKDLGAFVEQEQKGNGGVTIVVQQNVPLPSMKDVKAHQDIEVEKNKRLLEDAKSLLTPRDGDKTPPDDGKK